MNWCIFRVKVPKKQVFTPSLVMAFSVFIGKSSFQNPFRHLFQRELNNFYHTNVVVGGAITVPSLSWTSPAS